MQPLQQSIVETGSHKLCTLKELAGLERPILCTRCLFWCTDGVSTVGLTAAPQLTPAPTAMLSNPIKPYIFGFKDHVDDTMLKQFLKRARGNPFSSRMHRAYLVPLQVQLGHLWPRQLKNRNSLDARDTLACLHAASLSSARQHQRRYP